MHVWAEKPPHRRFVSCRPCCAVPAAGALTSIWTTSAETRHRKERGRARHETSTPASSSRRKRWRRRRPDPAALLSSLRVAGQQAGRAYQAAAPHRRRQRANSSMRTTRCRAARTMGWTLSGRSSVWVEHMRSLRLAGRTTRVEAEVRTRAPGKGTADRSTYLGCVRTPGRGWPGACLAARTRLHACDRKRLVARGW